MKHREVISALLYILLISFAGCRGKSINEQISGRDIDLEIDRFETELFSADPSMLENYIPGWEQKYGVFFGHFNYILNLGTSTSAAYSENLRNFVTDPFNYRIFKRTMEVFPDIDTITLELETAFKRYNSHFPSRTVPRVITYISGFTQTAISDDSLMAIGLDMYLGSNDDFYSDAGVYKYLSKNMHPDKVVPDCMLFWEETEFPFNDSVNNLVSNLIYQGRLLYLAGILLPDKPDTLLWGFSEKDFDFCTKNEEQMWTYLVSNKLLFNTDRLTIDKYLQPAPFTTDFGNQSPGRAAIWTGYRIVESYMRKNPSVSIEDLMKEDDYMNILNMSSYNPE